VFCVSSEMQYFTFFVLFFVVTVECTQPMCIKELVDTPDFLDGMLCSDCQAITFGDFKAASGDDEGRLCVEGNIFLGPFSVGDNVDVGINGTDNPTNFSLVSGGDANWSGGSLSPAYEGMFVGGVLNAPAYLHTRQTGGPCSKSGCLNSNFAKCQNYYEKLAATFAATTVNTNWNLKYNNILYITGIDPTASRYYISIPAVTFNMVTTYVLLNVNFDGEFILTISGYDDVVIQGGSFPVPARHVVYNIPGVRKISAGGTGINGSVLAPDATFSQPTGVADGFLITSSVLAFNQLNKLNCHGSCVCENYK